MKLQLVASHFRKYASDKAYKDLIELNNLAAGMPIDIYNEKDEVVLQGLKDLAKTVATLADKAYRQGLSASDFAYLLDKAKTKATLLKGLPLDNASKSELDKFYQKLVSINPVDIPAKLAPEVGSAFKETFDNKLQGGEGKGESDAALGDVAKGLGQKTYPMEGEDLGQDGKLVMPGAKDELKSKWQAPTEKTNFKTPSDEEASNVVKNLGKDWKSYDLKLGPNGELLSE